MLVFIDESGYPRPTDATNNPVLLAVCLHENDIKSITNQIYKLKEAIYGKQDEIKATKLIRETTIIKNRTNNKAYVEGMIDIILSYDAAIFAVIMNKPTKPIHIPEHHLPKQYYLLLKKIEYYCKYRNLGKAILIFDEVHEEADRKITEAFTSFLFKTSFGRSFKHILEMPLFVSSSVTPSIQFADIFAGIIRHYYENHLDTEEPTTDYQKWLVSLFKKLQRHFKNTPIPDSKYIEFALQRIGTHYTYNVNMNSSLPLRIKEDFLSYFV